MTKSKQPRDFPNLYPPKTLCSCVPQGTSTFNGRCLKCGKLKPPAGVKDDK